MESKGYQVNNYSMYFSFVGILLNRYVGFMIFSVFLGSNYIRRQVLKVFRKYQKKSQSFYEGFLIRYYEMLYVL